MRLHLLSTRAAAPAGLIDQLPEGWNVQSVDAVERTLEAAAGQAFDAIVCSVHVPGATAESVLARVRDAHPAALRILSLPPAPAPVPNPAARPTWSSSASVNRCWPRTCARRCGG